MPKIKNRSVLLILMVFVTSLTVFAGGQKESDSQSLDEKESNLPVTVFTSILPQKYFVEKIGGDRVLVEVLVGPGKSPATYEPAPHQIELLGKAKIWFTIGVPFEKAFLPTIENTISTLEIVDTAAGIQRRRLDGRETEEGTPGHGKGAEDPHIWLSARQAKVQAENMYNALVRIDPAGEADYTEGLNAFIRELEDVDVELASTLSPFQGNSFFVFHPAFGYLADDYGLTQVAIETGGKEPAPSVLEEIIEQAKDQKVKIIFVQPEFSKSSAQTIAEAIDGTVVMLSPLNPDYINNLKSIAGEVRKAFE